MKLSAIAEDERRKYVNHKNSYSLALVKKNKIETNVMTLKEEKERKEYIVKKQIVKKHSSSRKKFKNYLLENGFITEILERS
jgi:hypothetical protein